MNFTQQGLPKIGTVIRGKSPVSCMSYHEDGTHLYVASKGESSLKVVDCLRGTSDTPLKFEQDGINLVEATHHNQCLLISGDESKQTENLLSYLSLHDNKILRQFRGHKGEITDISMSPVDDTFLTCSADKTMKLWDLKQAGSIAEMITPKSGNGMTLKEQSLYASYDSTGLVFGVTASLDKGAGHLIHLYDARNYGNGAFAELKIEQSSISKAIQSKVSSPLLAANFEQAEWCGMKFNKSGKSLLVTTKAGIAFMIDGYDGSVTNVFTANGNSEPMAACLSSDDNSVLCSGENGEIHVYDSGSGALQKKLEGHSGHVGYIATNPKYAQFASSCSNTSIWLW